MRELTPASRAATIQRFAVLSSSFEGAEAIYREKPHISGFFHVRVSQVTCDDWGVKTIMTDLLAPGMQRPRVNPFRFECTWELMAFSETDWSMSSIPGANWILYFDPAVIRGFVEMAAARESQSATMTWEDIHPAIREYESRLSAKFREFMKEFLRQRGAK